MAVTLATATAASLGSLMIPVRLAVLTCASVVVVAIANTIPRRIVLTSEYGLILSSGCYKAMTGSATCPSRDAAPGPRPHGIEFRPYNRRYGFTPYADGRADVPPPRAGGHSERGGRR